MMSAEATGEMEVILFSKNVFFLLGVDKIYTEWSLKQT